MAKMRSPNYPSIGLSEGVELARTFWARENKTAVPLDVAASALGYKSASGPARTKLAALKKYGLLEGSQGIYRISDIALRIIHPANEQEKHSAIVEAAYSPELFRQLRESHLHASVAAIKSHLINQLQFSEIGADQCIAAFKDTIKFADSDQLEYDEARQASGETGERDTMLQEIKPDSSNLFQSKVFTWPLSGEITAELRLNGGDVTPEHLDMLAAYLEIAKKALKGTDK